MKPCWTWTFSTDCQMQTVPVNIHTQWPLMNKHHSQNNKSYIMSTKSLQW
jgi:hypothetical protein